MNTQTKPALNYTLWTIQILLAMLFLFAGSMKLILPLAALAGPIHLPGFLIRFIGVAEVAGALGLVLPGALRIRKQLTPLAAAGLVVIMIGATVLTVSVVPAIVGILAAFVVYQRAAQPGTFRVERARTIQAPPEKVYDLIHDFQQWAAWSPYEKLDPAMKKSYAGAPRGTGAVYEWSGNRKAGQGRMEITESSPASKVTIKLDFLKPFEGHNTAEFILQPEGNATQITWATYGPLSRIGKVMSLFFSMDNLVGRDFETGLANIKAIAEGRA
jgi:uncharacterized protein YndB with AHSA1/START domain